MKRFFNLSFAYAIAAGAGGVFYREFTKLNGFSGTTTLGFVHTHLFVLGMLFFLVLGLLEKQVQFSAHKLYKPFMILYNAGLLVTVGMLISRGILQVFATPLTSGQDGMISGIAGLGHICLFTGLMLFFVALKKQAAKQK